MSTATTKTRPLRRTPTDILRQSLACPDCRGNLISTSAPWSCEKCERPFAVAQGGVPILLARDSEPVRAAGENLDALAAQFPLRPHYHKQFPYRLLPRTTPYYVLGPAEERLLSQSPAGAPLLHLGAGDRRLDTDRPIIELDIRLTEVTNVIGDGHALPLRDGSVAAVISHNVFEYLRSPAQVAAEIERVLMPGGMLLINVALILPLSTPEYHDRWRFTPHSLQELFPGLEPLEIGASAGPIAAFAVQGDRLWDIALPSKWLAFPMRLAWGWFWQPLKQLDPGLMRRDIKRQGAASFYLLARKPT